MVINVIGCRVGTFKDGTRQYGIIYSIVPENSYKKKNNNSKVYGSETREFFVPSYCINNIKDYVGHKCYVHFVKNNEIWGIKSINIVD